MNPLFPSDRLVGMTFWSSASNCLSYSTATGACTESIFKRWQFI